MGKDSGIGINIKRLLDRRKISSKKICADLGIPSSTFSQYLSGTEPRATVLLKISRYLGVSVEELIEPQKVSPEADPITEVIETLEGRRFVEVHTGVYRVIISKEIQKK